MCARNRKIERAYKKKSCAKEVQKDQKINFWSFSIDEDVGSHVERVLR